MKLTDQYHALKDVKRSYDHQSWHAVNVKRYDDYILPEVIEAEAKRLTKNKAMQKALMAYGKKYGEDQDDYYSWLGICWDMLNEDIIESGMLSLKHIKLQDNKRHSYIYSLGRSGGWACFQDTAGDIAEELDSNIENLTVEEIADHGAGLEEAIKEIEALKEHIKNYNKGCSWKDEVFYRMDEHLQELEDDAEEERKATNNKDITTMTLGQLLSHSNDAIKRNAIGIMKQLNKN